MPDILPAAKAEGALTVYGSMNEQEALPLWKGFEDATGIKTSFVRGNDNQLLSRIAIEARAQQHAFDVIITTAVMRIPPEHLLQFEVPEVKAIKSEARDPNKRWYGVYANYNAPAFNTKLVKPEELPRTYEEFATKTAWKGKVAIDNSDIQWMFAMIQHYGEDKAKKIVSDIVAATNPIMVDGHLALARSVGAGEYAVALNNYANLTVNVQLSGGATDFWVLEPVALFFGQVGVNAKAPHPKAALLAANYALSKEGQSFLPKQGRMPVRADVAPIHPT